MNKEILEIKIADLLDVSSEEKKIAFSSFKEKLASFLKIGEAVRIKDVGVFQLKEKFKHDDASKSSPSSIKNLTILFSSDTDKSPSDSLFLNLDLDNKLVDDTEFSDDVFQLGIGKSIVTKIEDGELDDSKGESDKGEIEEKISSLLASSEKIENFDLWEDHFKTRETKSILDGDETDGETENDTIEEELIEAKDETLDELPITADEDEVNEKDYLEEDFVELNDEEKLESYLDENNILLDEDSETTESETEEIVEDLKETSDDQIEDIIDEIEAVDEKVEDREEIEEPTSLELESIAEEELEIDENLDDLKIEDDEISNEKSVIDEIELELQNENDAELDEDLELKTEENDLVSDDVIEDETGIDSELKEEMIEDPPKSEPKKKNKTAIFILIGIFSIVGALAIYYLFFNNTVEQFSNESGDEQALVQNDNGDDIDSENPDKPVESINNENLSEQVPVAENESLINQVDEQKSNIKDNVESSVNDENESLTGGTNEDNLENEVSENIFYDGYVYNVQVSSWKNRDIAEKEVNKLIKKGFPAYIVKIYIPKFQGTWHRVRIGPYTSLDEAKIAQSKI